MLLRHFIKSHERSPEILDMAPMRPRLLRGTALAFLAAAFATPQAAWADGGYGLVLSPSYTGAGGTDGTLAQATGRNGDTNSTGSGGAGAGGGAVDLTTGNGAPGGARGKGGIGVGAGQEYGAVGATGAAGLALTTSTSLSTLFTGGAGSAGQAAVNNVNTTGGGGGGGVGVSTSAGLTIAATGSVTGGAGAGTNGGSGGGGGAGLFSTAQVTVAAGGRVTGGAGGGINNTTGGGGGGMGIVLAAGGGLVNSGILLGGAGGSAGPTVQFGGGGDGGAGVWVTGGGTVFNMAGGSITGGVGGKGRYNVNGTRGGLGGEGVKGSNLTLINAGTITAAMGGTSSGGPAPVLANAVTFLGGINALEIQAGSTITGNVVAFSTADTLRLGGSGNASFDISQFGAAAQYRGFGIYEKVGAGTWTLTGATATVTPWTMTAGVLQVAGDGHLGDASGGLTFNGGTLENTAAFTSARGVTVNATGGTLQTGADLILSGSVSGVGVLTKTGTGNLILTGASTNTGGIVITAGTVQLGNGGPSGSVIGNVTNNAALIFNNADTLTLGGAVSGSGTVQQAGSGATTLSGVNSYTGGTTIAAGTLTGSAASFGSGAIFDNGALVIDQPADATMTNVLNGTGSFTKRGAGRLNYIGSGSLSGPTTVAAGLLSVNGSLAGSAVTVQSGATLGGNGTTGAASILSGATIAPGNSIGTLNVNGAFVQSSGSVYQVEVDPNSNAADLIAVNGTATLGSGAALNVTRNPAGNFRVGTQYTVLSASGGVNGTYVLGGDIAPSAFLNLEKGQDANTIYLKVVQTGSLVEAAQTPNQTGVATAVDALPDTGSVPTAVLNVPTEAAARDAFDTLSGEAFASAKGALISGSLLVRDTTFDRLRDVFCATGQSADDPARHPGCASDTGRPAVWGQGFGSWGELSGNSNAASLSQSTNGFLTGVDVPIDDWRAGIFGGYSRTDFDIAGRNSSGASNAYHLGLYGGTQWGDVGLRLGASYSWNGIVTERLVAFGDFSNRLRAVYNAGTTQLFGELGERFVLDRISLEPFANLSYVNLNAAAFREVGGDAALSGKAGVTENMFTTLGVRPSTEIAWDAFHVTLRGMLGWRHTFGDVTPQSTVSFAGGNSFTVSGAPIARDAGAVEAGLGFRVTDGVTAAITYGGQFSGTQTDNGIRGTFAVTF